MPAGHRMKLTKRLKTWAALSKLIYILGWSLLVLGCKPGRQLPVGAPPEIRPRVLIKEIAGAENHFQSLRIKAIGNYRAEGQSQAFRLELRLLKDSLIWVDLADPVLGLKVVRVLITPDSLRLINRLDREYYTGDIEELQKRFNMGFGFGTLQQIFGGNLLFDLTDEFDLYYRPGKYLWSTLNPSDSLRSARGSQRLLKQVQIDPKNFKPVEQSLADPLENRAFTLHYKAFEAMATGLIYPQVIEIEYAEKENSSLSLSIRKVERDDPELRYPFKIPGDYERME